MFLGAVHSLPSFSLMISSVQRSTCFTTKVSADRIAFSENAEFKTRLLRALAILSIVVKVLIYCELRGQIS